MRANDYIVIRYVVVRPVRHLRDVSDAIAHGEDHEAVVPPRAVEQAVLDVDVVQRLEHLGVGGQGFPEC